MWKMKEKIYITIRGREGKRGRGESEGGRE
jgi:hypothetical protein